MDIMELGAIGEMVGGIAVIGSLLYVGLQVRQSNEQARRSNAIERARTQRDVAYEANEIVKAMNDPEILRIYRESLLDFDANSENEKALLHLRFLLPTVLHAISAFVAAQDDLIDEEFAERLFAYLVSVLKSPGITTWWDHTKETFHPGFVREIDRLQREPDSPPAWCDTHPWFRPDEA